MGQPTPGTTPAKFAPGVVNTDAIELNGVFTPDGREFFFTRLVDGVDTIYRSVFEDGKWSAPQPLLLYSEPGDRDLAVDMSVSPDGQELFFLGQSSREHAGEKPGSDLWVSRRADGKWATARMLPAPMSTAAEELYPVVVADGSVVLLLESRRRRATISIALSVRRTARFAEPVAVGPPIFNEEFGSGDTFVAPDESYLVLSSRRPPGAPATAISSSRSDRRTEPGERPSTSGRPSTRPNTSSARW